MSDLQVNTHANVKFYVSVNPQNADLTLQEFGQLSWIQVGAVGSLPERGIDTNMLTYDTVDTLVAKKAKGITDAGTGTLECATNPNDPGQIKLATIGRPDYFHSHAFKIVQQNGTIEYGRGLVSGPTYAGGRNEDFYTSNFQIAYQQAMEEDKAGAGATSFTIAPHSGVSFYQLIINGFGTGFLAAAATDGDIEDAINAITASTGVTATSVTSKTITFDSPASLTAIGANIS